MRDIKMKILTFDRFIYIFSGPMFNLVKGLMC